MASQPNCSDCNPRCKCADRRQAPGPTRSSRRTAVYGPTDCDCNHPVSFHHGDIGLPCAAIGCHCPGNRKESRSIAGVVVIVIAERKDFASALAAIEALHNRRGEGPH